MIDPVVEARDRWLAATPAERSQRGPGAIADCGRALGVLTGRLAELGYPVEMPLEPCPDVDGAVAQLADAGIAVPPALERIWRDIGAICLVDLGRYRHVTFWDDVAHRWQAGSAERSTARPVPCCDGVVIDGPTQEGWLDYVIDAFEAAVDDERPPAIEIAPDDLHKDDVSGAGPYEVVLPRPGEDPWLATFDGGFRWSSPRPASAPPDPPDLVSYLRTALLECGGFPGLSGHPAFERTIRELTVDLPVF